MSKDIPTVAEAQQIVASSAKANEEKWFDWSDGKWSTAEAISVGGAGLLALWFGWGWISRLLSWIPTILIGGALLWGGSKLLDTLGIDLSGKIKDWLSSANDWIVENLPWLADLLGLKLRKEKPQVTNVQQFPGQKGFDAGPQVGQSVASKTYFKIGPDHSYEGQQPCAQDGAGTPLYNQGVELSFYPLTRDQQPVGTVEINGEEIFVYERPIQKEASVGFVEATYDQVTYLLPSMFMNTKPQFDGQPPTWIDENNKPYYASIGINMTYPGQKPCYVDPQTGQAYYQRCVKLSDKPAYDGQPGIDYDGQTLYEVPDQDFRSLAYVPGAKTIITPIARRPLERVGGRMVAGMVTDAAAELALKNLGKDGVARKVEEQLVEDGMAAVLRKDKTMTEPLWKTLNRKEQVARSTAALGEAGVKKSQETAVKGIVAEGKTLAAQGSEALEGGFKTLSAEARHEIGEKAANKTAKKMAAKGLEKVAAEGYVKAGAKKAGRWAAKTGLKMTLGKAPVIGGIVGGAFAVWRLGSTAVAAARGEQVDWAKQGQLALCEVGSGVLSTFPVAGTAGSVALDVYVLSNDMTDSAKKNDPSVPVQNFRPYSA